MEKVLGLLSGSFGVKISHRQNLKHTKLKIRDAIKELYKTRKEENLQKHNVASRKLPEYEPMEWEYEGLCCIATPGTVALDGAGKKRAFRHNINGDETATIAQSGIIDVPLALAHSH